MTLHLVLERVVFLVALADMINAQVKWVLLP
jgi:hypothetical protein